MSSGHGDSSPRPAAGRRIREVLIAGALILCIVLVVCSMGYLRKPTGTKPKPADIRPDKPAAELVRAAGTVLVQNPGRPEWREVKAGAHLVEGDLIRTDSSGEAAIRYEDGTTVSIPEKTVFTIRSGGDNRMEISVPPGTEGVPLLVGEGESTEATPFIELQQIVPFGRSLELIGRVDPGSSLLVNNEIVEVTGDGSFKHFTSPFPASAYSAHLSLKVTDLAGRTRIWTTTHNFGSPGEN